MRQRGGGERVDHQGDDELLGVQCEHGGHGRDRGDPSAGDDVEHEQHETEQRGLNDTAGAQETLVAAHDQGDRDGHTDGEHGPRRDGQNRPSAGTYDGDGGPQQGLLPCPYHFGTHAYGQSLRIANHTFGFVRRVIVLEFQLARCRGLGCGGGHNNPLFLFNNLCGKGSLHCDPFGVSLVCLWHWLEA